jgi:hypothetical protein
MLRSAELPVILYLLPPLKAQEVLSWRHQIKNAARGGSIYLVTPAGFKPTTFRTGI